MTSTPAEPPTLRSITSAAAAVNRRSYSCYNCNHAFHITPTTTTSASSPSSFRCPRCFHRHLIPHHTVSPSPPPPPPTPPPPPQNSDSTPAPGIFTYYTSDDFDSDYDYDSDNSLLSFTIPNLYPSVAALKSFIDSLPIKILTDNSTEPVQSCSICMEDFGIDNKENFEIVNELPCQHYFHKDCISEWLNRSNTCPLCRYKLPLDPGSDQLEPVEYDAVLVVDLGSPAREPVLRRVNAEVSLTSVGAAAEAAEVAALDFDRRGVDAMHDEDGDTLMPDV